MNKTKKTKIKTFKRFIKEEQEKWYSLDLYSDMTKEEVIYLMNQLFPLMYKMLKNTNVTVSVVPMIDSEEDES
jgi:hypothetical protein